MSKSGWPTISKGIFNPGLNKGKAQGKTAATRDNTNVTYPGKSGDSVIRKIEAAQVNTKQKFQKPLG